ncbi:MAG: GxxExxY protein [Planctomycetes bacterium]|nr:GxxExxY protein [Planctomycetota bacterium]
MNNNDYPHAELTRRIIGCAFRVYNALGPALPEVVYKNALQIAFRKDGIGCEREAPVLVFFEGEFAGRFYADFMCEKVVVLEVKAGKSLVAEHELQVKGYQILSKKPVALLLNFGPQKVEIHRRVETRFEQSA